MAVSLEIIGREPIVREGPCLEPEKLAISDYVTVQMQSHRGQPRVHAVARARPWSSPSKIVSDSLGIACGRRFEEGILPIKTEK